MLLLSRLQCVSLAVSMHIACCPQDSSMLAREIEVAQEGSITFLELYLPLNSIGPLWTADFFKAQIPRDVARGAGPT